MCCDPTALDVFRQCMEKPLFQQNIYVRHGMGWDGLFDVIDYINDANRFWQAVLVAQKMASTTN